jgi:nucleoporin GLE1
MVRREEIAISEAQEQERLEAEANEAAQRVLSSQLSLQEEARIRNEQMKAELKALEEAKERQRIEILSDLGQTLEVGIAQAKAKVELIQNSQSEVAKVCNAKIVQAYVVFDQIEDSIQGKSQYNAQELEQFVNQHLISMKDCEEEAILEVEKEKLEAQIQKQAEQKAREEEQRKLQEQQRLQQQEEEAKRQQRLQEEQAAAKQATAATASAPTTLTEAVTLGTGSQDNQEKYMRFVALKNDWMNNLAALTQSEADKSFRFMCQRAVNTPVNAISAISSDHLRDKFDRLKALLAGQPVEVGENKISASAHALGLPFCKNLVAKKLVSQGLDVVSAKPEQAFNLGVVVTSLWTLHADFGELFLAHLFESCPYLVPVIFERREGQSEQEFYKLSGYKLNEKGEVEHDKFINAMSGAARLYAAVTISPLAKDLSEANHPHGLGNIWAWLCAQLNMRPIHDVTATLIFDVLEVAGHFLFANYGKMFAKLLTLIQQEYLPQIEAVTKEGFKASYVRLEDFLQKAVQSGEIAKPTKMLKQGFF